MRRAKNLLIIFLLILLSVPGCGYTTRSLLPPNFKSIYVDNFANNIKISAEQSNIRAYRGYRPGMETAIRKAVMDKFLSDGNLKLAAENSSDLVLHGSLLDYRREPLRYDNNDNIEEYRITLIVNMKLEDVKAGNVVWEEKNFAGETTYRTSGSFAISEGAAVDNAIIDLARRIVERTIEAW